MSSNQSVTIYSFGFTFDNIMFCWKHKHLYRMPYIRSNKSYNKRKLKQQKVGGSYGYWICGVFKSMKNLKEITTKIEHKEINYQSDLPF